LLRDSLAGRIDVRTRRALFGAAAVLVAAALSWTPRGAAQAANINVFAVNVGSTALSVAWFTTSQVSGESVEIGTTCTAVSSAVGEQGGSDGYVHLSQPLGGLAPNTGYSVAIVQNGQIDNNNGNCWRVHTLTSGAPPSGGGIAGTIAVDRTTCTAGVSGALIVGYVNFGGNPVAVLEGGGGYSLPVGSIANNGDIVEAIGYLSFNENNSVSAPYSTGAHLPTICVSPLAAGPSPTPTKTGIPTATIVSTGFVTSTPVPTNSPTITLTPSVTATPTRTPTPTSTATITPTPTFIPFPTSTAAVVPSLPPPPPGSGATATATPVPTATSTPTLTPTPVKVTGWTRIQPKTVHSDGKAHVEVHTRPGVRVSLVATYPDKKSKHTAHGTTNASGVWGNTWVVIALQKGTVSVHLTLASAGQSVTLYRHFTVK
jgi:hypothetical protein